MAMPGVDKIIQRAQRLPARERRRLVRVIEASLAKTRPTRTTPSEPYGMLLAMAGTAHADVTDVSSEKYKHLADALADVPAET